MDKEQLANIIFINLTKREAPNPKIVDVIMASLPYTLFPSDKTSARPELEIILANILDLVVLESLSGKAFGLNVLRNNRGYRSSMFKLRQDQKCRVLDALKGAGYICQELGYKGRDFDYGVPTRVVPTRRFRDLCSLYQGRENFSFEVVGMAGKRTKAWTLLHNTYSGKGEIKLKKKKKDGSKVNLPFDHTVSTRRMTRKLNSYNRDIKKSLNISINLEAIFNETETAKAALYAGERAKNLAVALGSAHPIQLAQELYRRKKEVETETSSHQPLEENKEDKTSPVCTDLWDDSHNIRNLFKIPNSQMLLDRGFSRVEGMPDFHCGGRYYAKLQGLPSILRLHLKINSEAVCELDYSAMHPTILYHLDGVDLEPGFDPYLPTKFSGRYRKAFKTCMQIALNTESEKRAIAAIYEKMRTNDPEEKLILHGLEPKEVLEELKQHNSRISRHLFTSPWKFLQKKDSDIAEKILDKMAGVLVPVHDSFVVPLSKEAQLYNLMVKAYQEVVGTAIVPKIKRCDLANPNGEIINHNEYLDLKSAG